MNKVYVPYFDGEKKTQKTVNLSKSKEISEATEPTEMHCWYNSLAALEYLDDDAVYVEGFAVYTTDGKPEAWEHSWVEWRGEIIDTLPDIEDWTHGNRKTVYFPGIKHKRQSALKNAGAMPFARRGAMPKLYVDAFVRALRYTPTERKHRRRNS